MENAALDGKLVERARKILWYYERVDRLREHDEVIVCLDEKPHLQALQQRRPKVAMRASQIERQKLEHIRHGAVNFLEAFFVHGEMMRSWCLETMLAPTSQESACAANASACFMAQLSRIAAQSFERYLKRGDWASQADLNYHLQASWREYINCLPIYFTESGRVAECRNGSITMCADYV